SLAAPAHQPLGQHRLTATSGTPKTNPGGETNNGQDYDCAVSIIAGTTPISAGSGVGFNKGKVSGRIHEHRPLVGSG
ncbi:MAG: hypothetical protein L0J24_10090, partial [Corynebacterium flavescens]|uniref:hypothetical protein n=2 Tax=Corynebacterium flavescens TaxID=28028 RepID=UPI0026474278